jgi:hypothetical protein
MIIHALLLTCQLLIGQSDVTFSCFTSKISRYSEFRGYARTYGTRTRLCSTWQCYQLVVASDVIRPSENHAVSGYAPRKKTRTAHLEVGRESGTPCSALFLLWHFVTTLVLGGFEYHDNVNCIAIKLFSAYTSGQ